MLDYGAIQLNGFLSILVAILIGYIIIKTKPGLSLGIFLALTTTAKVIVIGPIALLWLFELAAIIAVIRYYLTYKSRIKKVRLLSKWILIVMGYWALYTLVVIAIASPPNEDMYIRNLLFYILIPSGVLLIISRDNTQIKGFAYGYVAYSVVNTYLILIMGGFSLNLNIFNQLTDSGSNVNSVIHNYHRIGSGFGITLILLYGLYIESKKILLKFLFAALFINSTVILFLVNSRQMTIAVIISLSIYVYLNIKDKQKNKLNLIANWIIIMVLVSAILINWYDLTLRGFSFDIALNSSLKFRSRLWAEGLNIALNSPFIGSSFLTRQSHNLFIGTMEAEGIIGLFLLCTYLMFAFKMISFVLKGKQKLIDKWAKCFIVIFIFGLLHGQFSGDFISIPHLYWPIAIIWIQASILKSLSLPH